MFKSLINIRLKQIYRSLNKVGILRLLVIVVLISFLGAFLYVKSLDITGSWIDFAIGLFGVSLVHFNRTDMRFLKSITQNYRFILFVEYLLIASPVLFFLFIHLQWIPGLILLAFLVTVPGAELKQRRTLNTKIQRLIPAKCLEWKSGVRKHFLVLIPVWILGFTTSFFIGSVPIALFVIGFITMSFYESGESYPMLIAFEMAPTRFISLKIKLHLALFSALAFPLIAAFCLFHIDNWYIPVIIYLIFISLSIYWIILKYAFYEPNSKLPVGQILGAIGILGALIPFILPVVWIFSVLYYFKSEENLNIYLHDYNS